jgi:hypothetical protein
MRRDLRRAGWHQPDQRGHIEKQVGGVDTHPALPLQVASIGCPALPPNATPRSNHASAPAMVASTFRTVERNTLRGFFSLKLASCRFWKCDEGIAHATMQIE